MPLVLLLGFLLDFVAIAYPLIGWYLWREWTRYHDTAANDYAQRCLWGAIGLLALILLGRFLVKALLSKRRPNEIDPHFFKDGKSDFINRPDGSRIHVESHGPEGAQPIVLIHGWNANTKNWFYQKRFFEGRYRLILMDLAGVGQSTRPANRDFSLDKMASDLAAVIEHTGARNPILWGHSMGGMTILNLLAKHKASLSTPVKGIILQNTTYTNPLHTIIFHRILKPLQKPLLEPLCWVMIALAPLLQISRWMSYLNGNAHLIARWATFSGTQTPTQLDFAARLSAMAPTGVMARGILGMFHYDVTAQLPTINVPALVITADRDRLTRPFASEYMVEKLPAATLYRTAPGNHQALLERHAEVNGAADAFIASL